MTSIATLFFVMLALIIKTFFFESFYSASGSMAPTLNLGETFWVSKLAYGTNDAPKRGEIVVFQRLEHTNIKRVIGLPGDKIQMKAGILYINEAPALRQYLRDDAINDDSGKATAYKRYTETLPDGQKHDIYEISDEGPLDNTEVYTVPYDQYFVMGDNRDQSLDSRAMKEVGFISKDKIIGKALD